jgi:hypothetical protein
MASQQDLILIGRWLLAVTALLIPDVSAECRVIGGANTECSVPVLPPEIAAMRKAVVNPSGRIGLDDIHEFSNRDGSRDFDV